MLIQQPQGAVQVSGALLVRHDVRTQYFKSIKQDSPGDQRPHKKQNYTKLPPLLQQAFFVRNSNKFVEQNLLKVVVNSNLKGQVEIIKLVRKKSKSSEHQQ
jgi:hypothetical protein